MKPTLSKLSNGLEVHWYVKNDLPIIDLMYVVRAGSRDDLPGKSGTADLLGALLDRGSEGLTAEQVSKEIESMGASRMINTDADIMTVGMHGLSQDVESLAMWLARTVFSPNLLKSELDRERIRILDRYQHLVDSSESLVGAALNRIVYQGTSYGRGAAWSRSEFEKITREDLVEFHQKWIRPDHGILVVLGRVDAKKLLPKLEELFGEQSKGWKHKGQPAPVRSRVSASKLEKVGLKRGEILILDRPGLNQAQISFAWPTVSIKAKEHFALQVGNAFVGEYFNSRLNSVIRDQLGLTYSISSGFRYRQEHAYFSVVTSTQNNSVYDLVYKTLELLDKIGAGSISTEEVDMAKNYIVGSFPLGVASLFSIASRRISDQLFGLGVDYQEQIVPKTQAVTHAEVKTAMAELLHKKSPWIIISGDTKEIEKSLQKGQKVRKFSVKKLSSKQALEMIF